MSQDLMEPFTQEGQQTKVRMWVAALAGRRPDAIDAEDERFPLARVPAVRRKLTQCFIDKEFAILVCAAACGTDLLALDVAIELGLETHIVLPFAPDVFRNSSVTDRPGEWAELYDRIISHAQSKGLLTVLDLPENDPQTYLKANEGIINKAIEIANKAGVGVPPTAIIVWDGESRGDDDVTQSFKEACKQAGFFEEEILTLAPHSR